MRIIHISIGGPDRMIIVNGERYPFEMHPLFGPALLDKRTGDPRIRQPGPRSPFWMAVQQWDNQGQRLDDEGLCVWDYEPAPILNHLGGKNFEVLGHHPARHGWPVQENTQQ